MTMMMMMMMMKPAVELPCVRAMNVGGASSVFRSARCAIVGRSLMI